MDSNNSNVTSFSKDNFSVYCKNDSITNSTNIIKEYKNNDCKYKLSIISNHKTNEFIFEYNMKVNNFSYLDSEYNIYHINGSKTIIFKYPGTNNNKLCLISGEIEEDKNHLMFKIKEDNNEHRIMQRNNNGILSLSYQSLFEKFGIFIGNYNSFNPENNTNNSIIQIILEIANRTFVYEKNSNNLEEIFYEILGVNNNGIDYNTKVLYKNIENSIIDNKGNIILEGEHNLFNIVIKPYIDKLNSYVELILDKVPNIDKNLFKYDNILLGRGYDNYLFPNSEKDIPVKNIIKKIKTKKGSN